MAPNSHVVVTLRLPAEQLKIFDFSENKPPVLKKPRKRGASAGPKSRKSEADDQVDDDSKRIPASTVNTAPDPILGSLPRSLKAAPVANTSGLNMDKTPCRKWQSRVIHLKTISGYTIGVKAWASDYTEQEWEQKQKHEAEDELTAEKAETPEPSKPATPTPSSQPKLRKLVIKRPPPLKKTRKVKEEPASDAAAESPDRTQEQSTTLLDNSGDDNSSEPPSEAASEPPSEAPSELA